MTHKQKKAVSASVGFAAFTGIAANAEAMHIMEGYLPATYCIGWSVTMSAVLDSRFLFYQKYHFPKQTIHDRAGYGRSIHFCTFIA